MIVASSLDNCSTCYIFVCEWIFHRRFENGRMDDECIGGEDRSVCFGYFVSFGCSESNWSMLTVSAPRLEWNLNCLWTKREESLTWLKLKLKLKLQQQVP